MGCGKLQQGSKVGKHFLQTTLNQVVAEKVITWIAGSSNPGRDHRDVILQVCTGSSNSTSKLNWISNIFEYHLHTSQTTQQLQLKIDERKSKDKTTVVANASNKLLLVFEVKIHGNQEKNKKGCYVGNKACCKDHYKRSTSRSFR